MSKVRYGSLSQDMDVSCTVLCRWQRKAERVGRVGVPPAADEARNKAANGVGCLLIIPATQISAGARLGALESLTANLLPITWMARPSSGLRYLSFGTNHQRIDNVSSSPLLEVAVVGAFSGPHPNNVSILIMIGRRFWLMV